MSFGKNLLFAGGLLIILVVSMGITYFVFVNILHSNPTYENGEPNYVFYFIVMGVGYGVYKWGRNLFNRLNEPKEPKDQIPLSSRDQIMRKLGEANGNWMSRTQLAASLGISRISLHDINLLEAMSKEGQIEAHREGGEWSYRLPSEKKDEVKQPLPLSEQPLSLSQSKTLEQPEDHSFEVYLSRLNDKDVETRHIAILGIVDLYGTQAIEPLIKVLINDENRGVRNTVAITLEKLGWQPGMDEAGASYLAATGKWNRCVEIGAPAVPVLIRDLGDEYDHARIAAVKALGMIGDERARDAITALLNDPAERVRFNASRALENWGID
jgi:biotin operon repressor